MKRSKLLDECLRLILSITQRERIKYDLIRLTIPEDQWAEFMKMVSEGRQ
jgi:hypothetical protein